MSLPPEDETRVIREEEWAVPDDRREAEPPPPPPEPPPGPPRGWLAVENPWPWLLLVLIPVAGILVWVFAFRGDDREQVPRVVGLAQPQAVKTLNDKGFPVRSVVRPGKAPKGRVFAQEPGAGVQLKKGQQVTIDVSNGAPPTATAPTKTGPTSTVEAKSMVAVPNVVGKVLSQAGALVEAKALVPDSYPVTETGTQGTVVSQAPSGGATLEAGKTVRLNVAIGGGTRPDVTIPDVVGQTAAEARAALWGGRLTNRTAYKSGEQGTVLTQEPSAGAKAPAFTQVTLTVGR